MPELHFDHDFRLDPMRLLIGLRGLFKWRCFSFQRLEAPRHVVQLLAGEASTGVTDVDEAVSVEVAEQQGANVLAAVARLGVAADHELFPEFDLELEP